MTSMTRFPDNSLEPLYLYALVTVKKLPYSDPAIAEVFLNSYPVVLEGQGKRLAKAFSDNGPGFVLTHSVLQTEGIN